MDWVTELREGFERLLRGGAQLVRFAAETGPQGELGREFNALAAELNGVDPGALTRERLHALRNRLAGILAAVHVLGQELGAEQQAELKRVIEEARRVDAALRARRS